jgi:hypothetical protein
MDPQLPSVTDEARLYLGGNVNMQNIRTQNNEILDVIHAITQ